MTITSNIQGFKNYYVTPDGRVFNLSTSKCLKPMKHLQGYIRVTLYSNRTRKVKLVHRLVASAYLSNPHNHPIVMHIDDNPSNNDVSNLKWGTSSENNKDAYIKGRSVSPMAGKHGKDHPMFGRRGKNSPMFGRIGEKNSRSKLSDKQRIEIIEKYKSGGYTHQKLGAEYGVSGVQIGNIIRTF